VDLQPVPQQRQVGDRLFAEWTEGIVRVVELLEAGGMDHVATSHGNRGFPGGEQISLAHWAGRLVLVRQTHVLAAAEGKRGAIRQPAIRLEQ
jgi:hypothetical protein